MTAGLSPALLAVLGGAVAVIGPPTYAEIAGINRPMVETFDVQPCTADEGCFAKIVIWNPDGSSTNTWDIDTPAGTVVLSYTTTLNGPCIPLIQNPPLPPIDCADIVRIRHLPEGVWSHPEGVLRVFENETGEILLFMDRVVS